MTLLVSATLTPILAARRHRIPCLASVIPVRIHTDRDRCTGHGICESLLPAVFEVGDDGLVHLLTTDLDESMRGKLQTAVAECPTQSLRLED